MPHARPLAVLVAMSVGAARADPPVITYRGTATLPGTATDQNGAPFTIAGMSGVTRRSEAEFVAVMDNSSKLVRLAVQFDASGAITQAAVLGGLTLTQSHDMEGIAPGATPDLVYISEEDSPAVRVFSLTDGSALGALPLPTVFSNRRTNLGLESLARSPDGSSLWTANEAALSVDGPVATSTSGTTVRLLRYNLVGGAYQPGPQFAYNVEPMHGSAISGSKDGLSDLLMLPDGRLIALERSLAAGATLFLTRMYLIDFAPATDVSGLPGLIGQAYTPVSKTLVYSGSHTNFEGLCVGPQLGPGRFALLGIIDDGDPVSVNAALSFEVSGVGPAPCDANCDGSTGAPALNVADFTCFLQRYATGDPYANCDASTAPPALNVADFTCFLAKYATGCQ
jgi:hypothetical protein